MADDSHPAGVPIGPEPQQSAAFDLSTASPGGRVPLREHVPSTSQLPRQISTSTLPKIPPPSVYGHLYGQQFVDLLGQQQEMIRCQRVTNDSLRKEMHIQRKMFEAERAISLKTTSSLNQQILFLEAQLQQASGTSSATGVQASGTSSATGASSTSRALSEPGGDSSKLAGRDSGARRNSMAVPPSRELKLGQVPTQAVSAARSGEAVDAAATSTGPGRLASIDESSKDAEMESSLPEDGIGLPGNTDPTLKDAGHTPMARRSLIMTTDVDVTGGDSGSGIKGNPAGKFGKDDSTLDTKGKERAAEQPNEGQDGYFDPATAPVDGAAEEKEPWSPLHFSPNDSPLEGPLGLTNSPDNERNKTFLGELNKKLSKVDLSDHAGNRSKAAGNPRAAEVPEGFYEGYWPRDSSIGENMQMQNTDGTMSEVPESDPVMRLKHKNRATFEEEEPEQPLRIKTSQNFGSALGKGEEVDYGKGFRGRQP